MISFVIGLLCIACMLMTILLDKTYHHSSQKDIKRQAQSGDEVASMLYSVMAYGVSVRLFLWIWIVVFGAAGFVLWSTTAPVWLTFVLVMVILWFGFLWLPNVRVAPSHLRISAKFAPILSKFLHYSYPLLSKITRLAQDAKGHYPFLYEKEDLIDLIEWQKQQTYNRIPLGELDVSQNALEFGDKLVRDVMVPRNKVQLVSAQAEIGPLLMDELHKTGHSCFLVYDHKKENLVGIAYLKDLISAKQGGTLVNYIKTDLCYVHEDYPLYQVAQVFMITKQRMFVVVNQKKEFVGLLTIDDVLTQLIGHSDEGLDINYEDRDAVADSLRRHETNEQETTTEEIPEVIK